MCVRVGIVVCPKARCCVLQAAGRGVAVKGDVSLNPMHFQVEEDKRRRESDKRYYEEGGAPAGGAVGVPARAGMRGRDMQDGMGELSQLDSLYNAKGRGGVGRHFGGHEEAGGGADSILGARRSPGPEVSHERLIGFTSVVHRLRCSWLLLQLYLIRSRCLLPGEILRMDFCITPQDTRALARPFVALLLPHAEFFFSAPRLFAMVDRWEVERQWYWEEAVQTT